MSLKDNAITIDGPKAEWTIFPHLCKGCGLCIEKCPVKTLEWSNKLGVYGTPAPHVKEEIPCIACNMCELVCPDCAIKVFKKDVRK